MAGVAWGPVASSTTLLVRSHRASRFYARGAPGREAIFDLRCPCSTSRYSFIATLNQYQGSNPPAVCEAQPNFSNTSGFYNCLGNRDSLGEIDVSADVIDDFLSDTDMT